MSDRMRFFIPPHLLQPVRQASHAAVQWPSRAARANLPALADDSHSNLGWAEAHATLVSRPLDDAQRLQLGFSFDQGALVWLEDEVVVDALPLTSEDEAQAWCDHHLQTRELAPTGQATMPYSLEPADYAVLGGAPEALRTLGHWFAMTDQLLAAVLSAYGSRAVALPSARCWPHHFDLAALLLLDRGDPETARSIGIGLSPGDESYAEPYFYCTPWPKPAHLPAASGGFAWHTEGFTSMVCPVSAINLNTDFSPVLLDAVRLSFEILSP